MTIIHLETEWSEMKLGQLYILLLCNVVSWHHVHTARTRQLAKQKVSKLTHCENLGLKLNFCLTSLQQIPAPVFIYLIDMNLI